VAREAIADGYDTSAVTSVPAADVERAVLDHVQKLLVAPELVARTWAATKREGEEDITEREVTSCWPTLPRSGASCSRPSRRGMLQAGRVVDRDSDGRRLVEVAVDDWIVDWFGKPRRHQARLRQRR
jgi:hypothetical protein